MRILVVSHVPLRSELGAAQSSLNLGAALRSRGHEVSVWSPSPIEGARWFDLWSRQRRAVETQIEQEGPFDVVDLPAVSISPKVTASAHTVARSVQPDLRYLWSSIREEALRWPPSPRLPVHALYDLSVAGATVRGWHRASVIAALGTAEERWLRTRFPWLGAKLRRYQCALSSRRQQELRQVRAEREGPTSGVRFLWIGRWAAHKGTRTLVEFVTHRAASHPEDRFTIAGTGDIAGRDLPERLVESGTIHWLPQFPRDQLAELLATHDAGLFTSSVEGWGLTLNEMIEAGMPVYATKAGAVYDLAPIPGVALLPFPPPPELTARTLPQGGDLSAYRTIFSWDRIAESYERSILDTLHPGSHPRPEQKPADPETSSETPA